MMRFVTLTFGFVLASLAHADPTPSTGTSAWIVDFNRTHVAHTWDESKATFDERAQAILWAGAVSTIPDTFTGGGTIDAILPRLELGYDVAAANAAILRPATKIYGHCGTDAAIFGPKLCRRVGDYDFALRGWMVILYRYWNRPDRLWPQARDKILHELSPEYGHTIHNYRFFCGFIPVHETENHILMTETSKYLTNQLLNRERQENGKKPKREYDNAQNGMTKWMLHHLQQFLLTDFQEYNSRPYQPYAFMAIQNLFEFAQDARVRAMAWDVMDYLAAKFAITSEALRRLPPYRRNNESWGNFGLYVPDGESIRMLGLTGAADFLRGHDSNPMHWDYGVSIALPAVLGTYRLPDAVGHWIFNPQDTSAFERFSYDGLELYARRPEYLISAGGIYTKIQKLIPFKMPNDGFTQPTTLIPARGVEWDAHQLLRIEGYESDYSKRINTCVAPDFACGLNPVVPATLPASCVRHKTGNWTFVNFNAPDCPLDYGFYAAVYNAPCDSAACRAAGSTFGFFEAKPAHALSFNDFVTRVLVYNGATRFSSRGAHHYVTSTGRDYEFRFMPHDPRLWPIIAIDGHKQERHTRRWPFVQGRLMYADGHGLVFIDNAALKQRLVLDVRDPMQPHRWTEELTEAIQ